jgi:hypothetical protein
MITESVLAAVLAATPLAGSVRQPMSNSAAAKYHVQMGIFEDSSHDMWAYARRADTGKFLKHISVCLQRKDNGRWHTRSCHKTSSMGRVEWILYPHKTYRLYIPATAYHYAKYTGTFGR